MYGENTHLTRSHLDELLRHHRHAQHLAGAPSPGRPRPTPDETATLVQQCVRYRNNVLTWCLQAIEAVAPYAVPAAATPPPDPFSPYAPTHGALIALRYALTQAVAAAGARADLDQLTTSQDHRLVECWRNAARGAALAEHDHAADLTSLHLTPAQQQTLIGDVAAVTQALVILDRRNHRQSGWTALPQPQRLGWAALACALDAAMGPADYSIDMRGWKPRARILRTAAPPGLPGVIHAQHNLLVRLNQFPTALNLRLIADGQHQLSTTLAGLADRYSPTLAARWTTRAATYRDLQRLLRDIGGNLGTGHHAATEAANALTRARALSPNSEIQLRLLHSLDHLFDLTDTHISDLIDEGLRRHAYLPRHTLDELEHRDGNVIATPKTAYAPAPDHRDLPVMELIENGLRPAPAAQGLREPIRSRAALHASLVHFPYDQTDRRPSI
ncbi:hypothetical protein [Nocardioides daphniae]|uniref:DUF222 domain-containing protein n=1 Tax=Nocardioides daphniae TaxID=402297 RepID=A0ABQ1QEP4_9ACTN|nr:hypothetical protein [Nocardioides daphniae]GGD24225.1 hypothetical protein GCM10007231_24200 [Nocardioides daphniae]